MFLTEGKTLSYPSAISASPTTGWQMLYESEMAWHKLEMGMTRLEHSAIVREDHSLLQEGVKEFFSKAKKWFQWAGQEFLRYLDKVIDTWVNIQTRIRQYLTNVEELKKKVKNTDVKVRGGYKAIIEKAQQIATSADSIKSYVDTTVANAEKTAGEDREYAMDNDAEKLFKGNDILKTLMPSPSNQGNANSKDDFSNLEDETLGETDMVKAINFAKDGRLRCLKTLQYVRNSFAKLINMGIRNSDAEKENVKAIKKASSNIREVVNKWISLINKATNAVISAISKSKSSNYTVNNNGAKGTVAKTVGHSGGGFKAKGEFLNFDWTNF